MCARTSGLLGRNYFPKHYITPWAQVVWATPANCAKALLSLSKGVGAAGKERVVKHVLDMEQDERSD